MICLEPEEVLIKSQRKSFKFHELRDLVYARLAELKLSHHGSTRMVAKGLLIVGGFCGCYALTLFWGSTSILAAVISLSLLTLAALAVQLGVMHDASHHCITTVRWINILFRMTLTAMGGSSILWYQNHVVAHHSETNIPGSDPDIDSFGLMRFHEADRWHAWHRWQHLYALPLYSLKALFWVWVSDFIELYTNSYKLSGRRRALFHLELALSRISHAFFFLYLPFLVVGSWTPVLIGYVAFMMAFGATMTVVFILAHITDVQAFMPEGRRPHSDWARHQLETTSDFSVHNHALTWLIGGLNFQIEHHIFPNISHLHYHKIQPVVKNYCEECGITYHEYPNMFTAIRAHFHQLRRFGKKPLKNAEAA